MHDLNHLKALRATWGSDTRPSLPLGTSLIRFPSATSHAPTSLGCNCSSSIDCTHDIN